MNKIKRKEITRKPSHPGEVLKEIFLDSNNISQASFARDLADLTNGRIKLTTMKTKLSEVIKGKRSMSAEFALLISKALGTNPKMWLGLQSSLDLWNAKNEMEKAS